MAQYTDAIPKIIREIEAIREQLQEAEKKLADFERVWSALQEVVRRLLREAKELRAPGQEDCRTDGTRKEPPHE